MMQACYAEIEVGSSIHDVEKKCGKPYQIRSRGGNTDQYEYIERVMIGNEVVQMRHYYLVVTDGRVVGKYMNYTETPPVYEGMYPDQAYPQSYP